MADEKKTQLVKPAAALVPPERKPKTPAEFKTTIVAPGLPGGTMAAAAAAAAAVDAGAARSAAGVRGGSTPQPKNGTEEPFATVEGSEKPTTTPNPVKAPAPAAQSPTPRSPIPPVAAKAPSEAAKAAAPAPASTPAPVTPRTVQARPLGASPATAAPQAATAAPTTAQVQQNQSKSAAPAPPTKVAPTVTPMKSLVERLTSTMSLEAGAPPSSIEDADIDNLSGGYFHALLFGPADAWKTSTAALFGGPERTAIIVTRRKEQLIPLQGEGFKWAKVAQDADALRYLLLHPEKVWPEWAKLKDRVLVLDDITEGQSLLVNDFLYYVDEKEGSKTYGQMVQLKDPRQAYKKAGDEYAGLLRLNLGRPQHMILTAVERNFNVEGTIDYRTEPDVPNKVMILTETELEFVFYMELGKDEMLTTTRTRMVTTRNPDTKKDETWREVTFSKRKLPLRLLSSPVLQNIEKKDLQRVWEKLQKAMTSPTPAPAAPAATKPPVPAHAVAAAPALIKK